MSKRTLASALGLALVLFLLQAQFAGAEYRGTDLWGNLTPVSHIGGLVDRYSISNYQLDYHVSVGVTHMDDVLLAGLQAFASIVFLVLAWLVLMIITAFNWAVNIDVVDGPNGLLEPVGAGGQHFYAHVIVPLLEVALITLGTWGAIKMLKRDNSDVMSTIVRAFVMTIVAMVIVYQPGATIGQASTLVTQLSSQIASTGGDLSNQFFKTFVYRPWVILQFSSLDKVCVSGHTDSDGFPVAASYGHPGAKTCHSVQHQDADGHGGYVQHFLPYAHSSSDRNDAYDALNHGRQPDDPDWKVDKTDAPAVDMMQGGGTVQRMAGVLILATGIAFAVLLLGQIALALLFAQVLLLLLLAGAPIVVIASILPWTQNIFHIWGKLLLQMLGGKVVFITLLVLIISLSEALTSVENTYGYLLMFMLQSALFIGAFFMRKEFSKKALGVAHQAHEHSTAKGFMLGTAATSVAAAAMPRDFIHRVWDSHTKEDTREASEHAPEPKDTDRAAGDAKQPVSAPQPDMTSPPASAGREYSPPGNPSTPVVTMPASGQATKQREEEPAMPTRSFREDLEQARNQPQTTTAPEPRLVSASAAPPATRENFEHDLDLEILRREHPPRPPVVAPET